MAIITPRYNHMIEFLLLRSLPVAPFHLLFYACLSACFHEIQFSVFGFHRPLLPEHPLRLLRSRPRSSGRRRKETGGRLLERLRQLDVGQLRLRLIVAS